MKEFYEKSINKVTEALHLYWIDKQIDFMLNSCDNKQVYMIGVTNPNWKGTYLLEGEHYDVVEIDATSCIIVARLVLKKTDEEKEVIVDCSVHCIEKMGEVRFFYLHMTPVEQKEFSNLNAFIGENQHKDDKYSQVMHGVFDVVLEYSCLNNTFRYDHEEYRKFFGMDKYYITIDQWFWSFVGEIVHPDDTGCMDIFRDQDILKRIKNKQYIFESDFRIRKMDGKYKWIKMNVLIIPNDSNTNVKEMYMLFKEVDNELRISANKMLTRTDSLTLIWNKHYSRQLIERYVGKIRKPGTSLMMIIDVDDLRGINDTYGRLTGDFVLTKLVENVLSVIEPKDVFGRYVEDSFVLFLADRADRGELSEVVDKVIKITNFDYVEKQIARKVHCTMGATFVDRVCNVDSIYEKCEKALEEASANEGNIIYS